MIYALAWSRALFVVAVGLTVAAVRCREDGMDRSMAATFAVLAFAASLFLGTVAAGF